MISAIDAMTLGGTGMETVYPIIANMDLPDYQLTNPPQNRRGIDLRDSRFNLDVGMVLAL